MNYDFAYVAPASRAELLRLLGNAEGCKLLAGGTDLVVEIRNALRKPAVVVDIKKIRDYRQLAFSSKTGLVIGAAVTCADLLDSKLVGKRFPALTLTAAHLGSNQVRQRATAVGNVCNASPCADVALALLALDASVQIASTRGTRLEKLENFFLGVKRTILKADEIVERVIIPAAWADARSGFEKLKRIKGHDLSLVSACLVRKGKKLRVAVGSCAPTPVVFAFAANTPAKTVVRTVLRKISPIDDVRCSREYRLFMLEQYLTNLVESV